MRKPRTLRARLALWYATILSVVLIAFAGVIYAVIAADEAAEPPAVAALEPPDETGHHVLVTLAIALPIALTVALAGGLYISRRALRGLEEIARSAEQLGAENLSQRMQPRPDEVEEVRQLTAALNAMLARVEGSVSGMRRFTENASHELRTPIAILMSNIEITLRKPRDTAELRGALEAALEGLGDVSRLAESLLVLARSDAGQLALERVELDAGELTKRVVEPYEAVASERGITLQLHCGAPAMVCADTLWLSRAVANLVDNAVKFTPAGGRVDVHVATAGEKVEIVVGDSGAGIAETDRARVFERFYRADATTGGFGLGLALARDVARSLGGDIVAGERSGGGAELRLTLPTR